MTCSSSAPARAGCARRGSRRRMAPGSAVAEEYRVGGTCVIRGCVPKKLLVYGAHFAEDLQDARRFGWEVGRLQVRLADAARQRAGRGRAARRHLHRHPRAPRGRDHPRSARRVTGPNEVKLADGTKVSAATILIATGAHPVVPDVPGAEHGITSNEVFHLDEMPKRVVIAGGGYIANEFAGIFHEFGCEVTMVNRGDVILRGYDEQIRDRLLQISLTKGIDFRFNAPFEKIEKRKDGALTHPCRRHRARSRPTCCSSRSAARRTPKGLGLEEAGVELGKNGAVLVDEDNQSLGAEHLRGRRRHQPRPAHPGRDPRGPGLRRHRVRQASRPGSIMPISPRPCSAIRRSPRSA